MSEPFEEQPKFEKSTGFPVTFCRVCKNEPAAPKSAVCSQCQNLLDYGLAADPKLLIEEAAVEPEAGRQTAAWLLDYIIYSFSLAVLSPQALSYVWHLPRHTWLGIFLAISLFFEAVLLSTVGASLGRVWFGIQIKNKDGNLLSFQESAHRAFKIWCGSLLYCMIGWMFRKKLEASGKVDWNQLFGDDRSIAVTFEPLSAQRIYGGILLILGCAVYIIWVIAYKLNSVELH